MVGAARAQDSTVVPLRYDADLAARGFPNPVAKLRLAGGSAWFIFDTGAGIHTLAHWFVEANDVELDGDLADSVDVVDATGERVEIQVASGLAAYPIQNGPTLTLDATIVADFPPFFEEAKVGGLQSPQLLPRMGKATTLDLRMPEFRIERFVEEMDKVGAEQISADQVRVGATSDDPFRSLLFAVRASSPSGGVWLGLNTGAHETSIRSDSPLVRGMKQMPGGREMGVAGEDKPYTVVREMPISFAGYQTKIDARIVDTTGGECGSDGRLGLDAMKACAFVFSADALAVTCN